MGAPILMLKAHAVARMMCSCKKFSLDPQGDHVLTCKKHTGATGGHNHVMDVLTQRSRDVKYGNSGESHTVTNRPVWSSDSVLEGSLPTGRGVP